MPANQDLAAYLSSGWVGNVEADSIEELTISGFPAATAISRGGQRAFRLYAVRFGKEVYRFIYAFAAQRSSPDVERTFRDSIATFRPMTRAEIDATMPRRLKIITIRPGDTTERLAAQMAIADRPLERFLILNGLQAKQPLKVGEQVKILVGSHALKQTSLTSLCDRR